MIVGQLARPQIPNPEKSTVYECGEPTIGSSWVQFDLRFYIVALVYLIFDVEVALFYPWAVAYGSAPRLAQETEHDDASPRGVAIVDMLFFFGVLLVGFAYLWRFGYLDWVRSAATTSLKIDYHPASIYVAKRAPTAPRCKLPHQMSRPRPLRDLVVLCVILVATVAAYARVHRFDFTSWDDYDTVARNPLLNPPTMRAVRAFWTRPHGDLYIPVTYTLWYAVARCPARWSPRRRRRCRNLGAQPFHSVNIALHIASAMLAFAVLDLLIRHRIAATLGALLFALHPVQVESVAWVSGAKDLLFGMLALLAIYEYLSSRSSSNRRPDAWRGRIMRSARSPSSSPCSPSRRRWSCRSS
jgi:NADH-quinone oxidoreductase subunit A